MVGALVFQEEGRRGGSDVANRVRRETIENRPPINYQRPGWGIIGILQSLKGWIR